MYNLETQLEEERSPLYYPQVDPRPELVEEFSHRIHELCPETAPHDMAFLLFQREMMLRRVPDPTGVTWANKLTIEGNAPEHQLIYIRYLLRKWLACLPPLFMQLSCLQRISLAEDKPKIGEASAGFLGIKPEAFTMPTSLFYRLTTEFVKTMPFFVHRAQDLRTSTILVEKTVFSLEEWWQVFVAKFSQQASERLVAEHLARDCIANRLATYLEKPSALHEPSPHAEEAMVDILAHSSIHSYVG